MPSLRNQKLFLITSLALLFLILIINYLDRTVIAFAITPIQQTFHINNSQFGAIGGAFGIGYLVMMIISGILVDRFKARRILGFSLLIWSMVSIFTGFSNGFLILFIFRILLGVFEAPAFPSNIQITSHWLPITSRARTLSIANIAIPLACAIGAPLISYLITLFDWRRTYFILGSLGIILAVLWLFIYRDNINLEKNSTEKNRINWRFLLSNPTLITHYFAYFTLGYLLFFAQVWLPGYLEQSYHLKLNTIGWFLTAPWLLAALLVFICATLSDKLLIKTNKLRIARSYLIGICQLLSAVCLIPVIIFHSLTISLIFITLSVGLGLAPNALFDAINIDLSKSRASTSFGIMNTFAALAGIVSPWVTGWLTHITGNFNAAFILMGVLTLISVVTVILFHQPDRYK